MNRSYWAQHRSGNSHLGFAATGICFLAGSMLIGCGYSQPNPNLQYAINNSVPTCSGADDCGKKWEAAQLWLAKHTENAVALVTPVLIRTTESDSTALAAQVTKEPVDSATYRIVFKGWCHNMFGCFPDHNQAAYEFNLFVSENGIPSNRSAPTQGLNSQSSWK
jgi:hypothetical protein